MPESLALTAFAITFYPVPVAARHDGWTPAKQREFIDALAACECVRAASQHVGMTARSAYRPLNRADAANFAAVGDHAQREGISRTRDTAIERVLHGERVPHYYRGRLVDMHGRYSDRRAIAVLRHDAIRRHALASSTNCNGSTDGGCDFRDFWQWIQIALGIALHAR